MYIYICIYICICYIIYISIFICIHITYRTCIHIVCVCRCRTSRRTGREHCLTRASPRSRTWHCRRWSRLLGRCERRCRIGCSNSQLAWCTRSCLSSRWARMHMHTRTHTHTCMHANTYVYTCIHTHAHTQTHTYIYIYVHSSYIQTSIHTNMHTYICMYTCLQVQHAIALRISQAAKEKYAGASAVQRL